MPTDAGFSFHQNHFIATIGDIQGCLHPSYSCPDDKDSFSERDDHRGEGYIALQFLNSGLDNGYSLLSGCLPIGGMRPATLLPDIGYLTMVGIYTLGSCQVAEGALM
ncbi:hypothetical protein ES703_66590 [subsurface metagenome]